ncbi:MAG: molybdopterin molybdotransferase MoeA [Magnetococcales bacterium]|nr:molybdopterin molybdotransferase MoeA [Magnetococcales bacterium]
MSTISKQKMISFDTAREFILESIQPIQAVETISVSDALGRVLAEPAVAAFNVPNHDNSAMDGYAVCFADMIPNRINRMIVVADLPAGDILDQPIGLCEAVRIMTGAPIPPGCDCVVVQEVVERQGTRITFPPGQKYRQNIRSAGEDIKAGSEVFPAGRRLSPADLAVLTSLGLLELVVTRKLTVAILSTGNEVVEAGQPLKPGQVYDSNRSGLRAALEKIGVDVLDLGLVQDDRDAIREALEKGSENADVIISTGGVSVGDYDLVKAVLKELGEVEFWKVAMKPGKPQAYGRIGSALFFGLPGNPVSGLTVFLLMVRPALLKLMGTNWNIERFLELPFRGVLNKKHQRMEFVRGLVHFDPNGAYVETTGAQGSGILSSMTQANAFIMLPETPMHLNNGERVRVMLIDYD